MLQKAKVNNFYLKLFGDLSSYFYFYFFILRVIGSGTKIIEHEYTVEISREFILFIYLSLAFPSA
jgi:hypothetical protein